MRTFRIGLLHWRVTVDPWEQAVTHRDGVITRALRAGRYRLPRRTTALILDLRPHQLVVNAQKILTADAASVRVSAVADVTVADVRAAVTQSADCDARTKGTDAFGQSCDHGGRRRLALPCRRLGRQARPLQQQGVDGDDDGGAGHRQCGDLGATRGQPQRGHGDAVGIAEHGDPPARDVDRAAGGVQLDLQRPTAAAQLSR